ncbi:hypothetical protein HPB48_022179 [Haemaphysalis longicornis]|uniref:ADAM10 cysteine-rich domain-containing protein n=1 Tax=Haemaphysalis longicornis TaxID=44386 RepID=A0A9J6FQJ6_HAELO|nr:hypothetical protein HPB48_022179 [Haemaphysalis longicornis]
MLGAGTEDCKEACAFPEMASHCGAKLQPGSPCDDMRGYCDVFHKCRIVKPQGFLSRLQLFFGGEGLGPDRRIHGCKLRVPPHPE